MPNHGTTTDCVITAVRLNVSVTVRVTLYEPGAAYVCDAVFDADGGANVLSPNAQAYETMLLGPTAAEPLPSNENISGPVGEMVNAAVGFPFTTVTVCWSLTFDCPSV